MQQEAEITVNGTRLIDNESMMVRLVLATFADIMANQLGFKDDGIPLTAAATDNIVQLRQRP